MLRAPCPTAETTPRWRGSCTLETEWANRKYYPTRDEAKADALNYTERFYSTRRMHSTVGYLSPNYNALHVNRVSGELERGQSPIRSWTVY